MKKRIIVFITFFGLVSAGFISCQTKNVEEDKQAVEIKNPYYSRTDTTELNLSNEEWKKVLPPDVYSVMRLADTEEPFTGKYCNTDQKGTYYCASCGFKLFKSTAKFASSCGWPSFFEQDNKKSIVLRLDKSYGMLRDETLCGRCGGHLGHIFDDGPAPTHKRYCMNSVALDFQPDK